MWREALESKGFKLLEQKLNVWSVNLLSKDKKVHCRRINGTKTIFVIRMIIHNNGVIDEDMAHIVKAIWLK